MSEIFTRRTAGGALFALLAPLSAIGQGNGPGAAPRSAEYRNYRQFVSVVEQIVASGGATRSSLGLSTAGRDVPLLTISAAGATPLEQRFGVLIIGGVDAETPAASEIALGVVERLLEQAKQPDSPAAALLQACVFYVVPRLSPDGVERYFTPPLFDDDCNVRPGDEDRDGALDEDPPNDMDGDGLICVMRRKSALGEWMIDPDEPRLMRKADSSKGEKGVYLISWEGIDDDLDGALNEDALGGVDEDRNWPHFYEPGGPRSGAHQLSEPQNRALAQFVVDHPNIGMAFVYGRHDNVVTPSKGADKDPSGEAFKELAPDDVAFYEFIGEKYRELSGMKTSAGARQEGALHAWLYSQRGVPTFAIDPWWPLDRELPAPASAPSDSQPASAPGAAAKVADSANKEPSAPDAAKTEERPAAADRPAGRGRRGAGGGPGSAARTEGRDSSSAPALQARVDASDTNKRWLKWCDSAQAGEGFVAWHSVQHPEYGAVELGGFRPYLQSAPPPAELAGLIETQTRFLLTLAELRPRPRFIQARVKKAGLNVWSVEARLINEGGLATHLAIARHIQTPPIVVRPKVPAEQLLGGAAMERVANLRAGGPGVKLSWLIRGAEGDAVELVATHRMYGEWKTSVTLRETPVGEEGRP